MVVTIKSVTLHALHKKSFIMASKDNHLVIMAGGIGSRFWPMSTQECPKQFIDVMGCGRTLIQLTVDRFEGVCPKENVWVVTSEKYAQTVHEQLFPSFQVPEKKSPLKKRLVFVVLCRYL